MKKIKIFNIAIFISIISLLAGCSSSKIEQLEEKTREEVPKEQSLSEIQYKIDLEYYSKFMEMVSNNQYDEEIFDLLDEWKEKSVLDSGDYYLCCYRNYANRAVKIEDNSNVSISDDVAYVSEGDFFIYRDFTVDVTLINEGLESLLKGIELVGNRFDLWEALLFTYANLADYNSLKNSIIWFTTAIEETRAKNYTWYDLHGKPLSERKYFTNYDDLFLLLISKTATCIVDVYPWPQWREQYRDVYRSVVKIFPNNAYVLSELGYGIHTSNLEEALKCFEKAYELNSTNAAIIYNAAYYSYLGKDFEKYEKYKNYLETTGDMQYIQMLKEEIAYLESSQSNK